MDSQESSSRSQSSDELLSFKLNLDIFYSPIFKHLRSSRPTRHQLAVAICAFLILASLSSFGLFALYTARREPVTAVQNLAYPLDPSLYVLGSTASENFRDSLRNDTKYITSWTSGGWTNDVMTYGNLLYLALLTDRIPIIPKFIASSHFSKDTPPIAFGEIFDVPRLSKAIGKPVLEWHQVKDVDSTSLEDLGCWSLWETVQNTKPSSERRPRFSQHPQWLRLDISYTPTPTWVKLTAPDVDDVHSSFWGLASLGFPNARTANLREPHPSPKHQVLLPPDEQLLCYDYLYFVSAHKTFEYERDYSPAWRFVVQHMRWTPRVAAIADSHVRRTLKVLDDDDTPPFISIHVRHGDFKDPCHNVPLDECYAPLSAIARRVAEVQQELLERKGLEVNHVIMTSDEKRPEWWSEVAALGWTWVDYAAQNTEQLYGQWYPVLIDAVIQSSGAGFVGTDHSTMSLLAQRRVESWDEGATRTVKWGHAGADDH